MNFRSLLNQTTVHPFRSRHSNSAQNVPAAVKPKWWARPKKLVQWIRNTVWPSMEQQVSIRRVLIGFQIAGQMTWSRGVGVLTERLGHPAWCKVPARWYCRVACTGPRSGRWPCTEFLHRTIGYIKESCNCGLIKSLADDGKISKTVLKTATAKQCSLSLTENCSILMGYLVTGFTTVLRTGYQPSYLRLLEAAALGGPTACRSTWELHQSGGSGWTCWLSTVVSNLSSKADEMCSNGELLVQEIW